MDGYTNGTQPDSDYDRVKELQAFDATKTGVKGLVDLGAKAIPKIFIRPPEELVQELSTPCVKLEVPVINFEGIDSCKDRYNEVVEQVLDASENWGFFQVVNHGISSKVLDKMIQGIRSFFELDDEVKKNFYSRDMKKQVKYASNYDLYNSRAANWRDTFVVDTYTFDHLDPNELPEICRDAMLDYFNQVLKLSDVLLELFSMGLGLEPDYLKKIECNKGWTSINHYYPACPAPELTLGTSKHTDPAFLTILLQDQIGGLQVFHKNQWVDVQPIPGALVINIGDILQIISNDKLKSVYHRVTANQVGPRISSAFFLKGVSSSSKLYGPIKELLSEKNPAIYREFTLDAFYANFFSRPLDDAGFEYLKIQNHGDRM